VARRALQERSEKETRLPSFLEPMLSSIKEEEAQEDMREILPLVLTWTLQPASGGEDHHLLSVSVESLANHMVLMDWTLGLVANRDEDLRLHPYQDEKIYTVNLDKGRQAIFFIRGNELFFTSAVPDAERVVDRLSAEELPAAGPPGAAERLLQDVPADRPLRAALSNEQGELPRTLATIYKALERPAPAPGTWEPLRAATLSGSFEPDGTLAGRLDLLGPSADWARTQADTIVEELRRLAGEKLRLDLEGSAVDDRIHLEFRIGVKS
jgi:hypothetical protein